MATGRYPVYVAIDGLRDYLVGSGGVTAITFNPSNLSGFYMVGVQFGGADEERTFLVPANKVVVELGEEKPIIEVPASPPLVVPNGVN